MAYDFNEILRRAMASGLGTDPSGRNTVDSVLSSIIDPLSGLQVGQTGNGGYTFNKPSDDPSKGQSMNWLMDQQGQMASQDPNYYTTDSMTSLVGQGVKQLSPVILAALGGAYASGSFGDFFGPPADGGASLESLGPGGSGLEALPDALKTMPDLSPWDALKSLDIPPVPPLSASPMIPSIAPMTASLLPAAASLAPALSSFGSAASGLGSLAQLAGPALGAIAGAQPSGGGTATNQRTLDPRVDSLFGGLLGDASKWYAENKSGQNDTMRKAQSNIQGLLGDPNVMAALYGQGAKGRDMMNTQVAANPFTRQGFNGQNWWG
jgi:hypothetical protein